MRTISWLVIITAAGSLGGCAAPTAPESQFVTVQLTPSQRNAGEIGQAWLSPRGNETSIEFLIGGVPSGVARPVRLYTYIYQGTCGSLDASPAYAMNRTLETYRYTPGGVWRLSKTAPVALSTLRSGSYSIVVRTSPADGSVDIFCGVVT